MTIGFILNGEDVVLQSDASQRLVDILRDHFNLTGTKAGCYQGRCGTCSIILNGKVVPACQVSAFKVRGGEVITIEGFATTDEYQDIVEGFAKAGVVTCGFCDGGKILATEALLEKEQEPSRETILAAFDGVPCRCTEPGALVAGVTLAAELRRKRLYGRNT